MSIAVTLGLFLKGFFGHGKFEKMTLLNGHLNVTAKSFSAAVAAVVTALVSFHVLQPDQAAQVTAVVGAFVAFVVPDRSSSGSGA